MKKLITVLIILSTTFFISYSQNNLVNKKKVTNASAYKTATSATSTKINRCASDEAYKKNMATDPVYRAAREKFEQETDKWVAEHPNYQPKTTVIIPVVVHIIYKAAAENISDARVAEQLAYTNADYAGTNPHSMNSFSSSLKANTNIQFCLATVDPSGNPTTGITRTLTTVTQFNITGSPIGCSGYPERCASSGGCDAWDVTKYLNIWVCNAGGGLCGISEFPTSPNNVYYGTTINYLYFGHTGASAPYNLGGTYTHESGHCLNLFHNWGDDGGSCSGSDNCADTPNQANNFYGSHESGNLSESGGSSSATMQTDACTTTSPGVMYENFMDYTDDIDYACFTPNQVTRMTSTLANADLSLTTSAATHCSTTTTLATVTTTTATAITSTTATSGGNVTSDGGATVTARGVCWATTANPVATGTHTTDGTGTGIFASSITGLTAGTTYHYRAYATNSVGTAYGSDLTFTTAAAGVPTLTTTAASSITNTTAVSGGNITSQGSAPVTARGVCWATTASPTISGSHTTDGTGIGIFTSNITGLTSCTLYHVRAYATNTSGTAYGNEITFTTTGCTATCDTLMAASFTSGTCASVIYYIDATPYDSGYVSGQNAYLDKEKAMLYSGGTAGTISDVFVMYGLKAGTTGNTSVKIYSSNAGAPGTLLGTSATIVKSAIDTTNHGANFNNKYHFATPVAVGTDFFVSVVLPTGFNNTNNQLAIWSSTYSCSSTSPLAYEMWSDNSWNDFVTVYGTNIDMAIFPTVCSTLNGISEIVNTDISIYPNPAGNEINVLLPYPDGAKVDISIMDIYGKLCKKTVISNSKDSPAKINISELSSGIYLIQGESSNGKFVRKISVIK